MTMPLEEIDAYLHRHIPMTRHLGATVKSFDGASICVAAPLGPNLNHRNTAFSGSISTLGILSAWTLLHLKLREVAGEFRIVIQKSTTDFMEPVEDNFEALCALPSPEPWQKFLDTVERKGKARIVLISQIRSKGSLVGRHEGRYVATKVEESGVAPL